MNEKPTLNIVLVVPRIPQNTGNVARTCACTAFTAALVRKVQLQKHLWQETACSRSATRLSPGIRAM